jgi:hypothetical protein
MKVEPAQWPAGATESGGGVAPPALALGTGHSVVRIDGRPFPLMPSGVLHLWPH